MLSIDAPGTEKRALLERAAKAALAKESAIAKVEASFAEEIREILVITSDGKIALDNKPPVGFGGGGGGEKRKGGGGWGGGRGPVFGQPRL